MESIWTLEGKIAYITGSTRGIGAAIARLFASEGAAVIVTGRGPDDVVERFAQELSAKYGTECLGVVADQRDHSQIKTAYARILKSYGRLDVLVNNAGVLEDALLGMISDSSIEQTFQVNAFATVHNMQYAARLMQRRRSGSIINMSSIMGTNGNAGEVVYAGSKAAVIGITKSAAKELAPSGVRVNAIAPGFINTEMTRSLDSDTLDRRIASIGMGRAGEPEDVARAALFLASDLSSYVTGQVIGVDGSMLI